MIDVFIEIPGFDREEDTIDSRDGIIRTYYKAIDNESCVIDLTPDGRYPAGSVIVSYYIDNNIIKIFSIFRDELKHYSLSDIIIHEMPASFSVYVKRDNMI